MKIHKIILFAAATISLCVFLVLSKAENNGVTGHSDNATGSGAINTDISGTVYFSEYYSKGGKKCTAFIEADDGTIFCVLDNPVVAKLKSESGAVKSNITITGVVNEDGKQKYIEPENFNLTKK